MEKQKAGPQPTPTIPTDDQPLMPLLMEHLSLNDKTSSNAGTEYDDNKANRKETTKTKKIEKPTYILKRSYKKKAHPGKKENYKKKSADLERKVGQLEEEIDRLRRKMEVCPQCRYYSHKKEETPQFQQYRPNYEEEMKKIAGSLNDSHGSMGSVEFEAIDLSPGLMMSKELDDKAWVYIGVLMIAMGSKCLQVDGTINIFRVLKQSVDTLRRQVEKSQTNISIDFYLTQEEMKEHNFMEDIGFDPFTEKIGGDTGLALEGIKVESVEQFELIYDNKLSYNVKYEALLGAMQYLRENSWLTF